MYSNSDHIRVPYEHPILNRRWYSLAAGSYSWSSNYTIIGVKYTLYPKDQISNTVVDQLVLSVF